ncbi:porin [Desulfoluna sp.]|uniref:OprO/OprP family phosphate-selective porin n=1 Tax=Desulfoluna sp. TaxID=2045199 RepID=UPI0026226F5C|nr:porin [Desulfoluna sp.]
MKKNLVIFFLTTFLVSSSLADARQNDLLNLVEVLNDNGTITTMQYEELKDGLSANTPVQKDPEITDVQVSTKGGIEIATCDGQYAFELGGRLMVDAAFYDQDRNDHGNGTELSRVRIDIEGVLHGDWGYELGIDFADGGADIKDAYVSYDAFWPAKIQIGQFKEPFSLEALTNSKYITFMERALPHEFAPGRSIGVGARSHGDVWSAAAGLFGEAFDDDVKDEGDEGWGMTGRATFSPLHSETRVMHFGAAASFREPNDEKKVRFNQRPESHITDIKYLDTGKIDHTDRVMKYGLEAAGVFGPLSLQGEYISTNVSRDGGSEDCSFDGYYVYVSWFATGETRPYKEKKGGFGRIKPKSKNGALELAARYSMMDLNDGSITGGKEENSTFGVNWYINPHTRLMANYILVNNDKHADADGDLAGNDDPKIFQARFQIDF